MIQDYVNTLFMNSDDDFETRCFLITRSSHPCVWCGFVPHSGYLFSLLSVGTEVPAKCKQRDCFTDFTHSIGLCKMPGFHGKSQCGSKGPK